MKLKDLNVGDVCITTYQDYDDDKALKAISIVSNKNPDGSAQFSDIVTLNYDIPDLAWRASEFNTTIKEVLFNQKMPKTLDELETLEELEELVKEKLRKDFPEYIL